MANLSSAGGSPITFVDASGVQYSMPLTFVTFPTATGAPVVSTWPGWSGKAGPDQSNIAGWAAYLAQQQMLTANVAPLPPSAFTITARDAGSSGNDITVTFGTVTPNTTTPSATTVDVTVSTTQIYTGLTPSSISTILGTAPLTGTEPGLAYVSTALTTLPTAAAAANFAGTPAIFDVPGSGGGVLTATHDATTEAADAALIQAAISDVDAGAGTFTLTLSWTKSQSAVALSDLAATFGYLVTITPPSAGFVYAPAANSSITLVGGTDPTTIPPNPATATVAPG